MVILLLLLSQAFAETVDLRSLKAKTRTRDHTYCLIGRNKYVFKIRNHLDRTEPKERKYGDYIFFYPKKRGALLPINQDRLNSYRFFPGKKSLCTKSYGYSLGKERMAILFLRENRPYIDKLAIQIFNTKTVLPEKFLETDYAADQTAPIPEGFVFRSYVERMGMEMGTTKIKDIEYFFQDRHFPFWMKYTNQGFEVSPTESFKNFEWARHYESEKDFLEAAGWSETEKKFLHTILYVAVNHKEKKECVLLLPKKSKFTGSENWRCR